MRCCQTDRSKRNHSTIENKEICLIVPKISAEALPELSHSEYRPNDDGDSGKEDASYRDLHKGTLARSLFVHIIVQPALAAAPREVRTCGKEDKEANGLEKKSSNHDVDTNLRICLCHGCVCHSTANGLQN